MAGSSLVEGGVGTAIAVHGGCCCWPRWREEELVVVSWRMGAFCVVGDEELLAVSWREGFGVEMGGYGFVNWGSRVWSLVIMEKENGK